MRTSIVRGELCWCGRACSRCVKESVWVKAWPHSCLPGLGIHHAYGLVYQYVFSSVPFRWIMKVSSLALHPQLKGHFQ